MGDKKTRSKSKNDPSKIVEITPNYVNGPVKKLFVDMLSDMKASKKMNQNYKWLKKAFKNSRALYSSKREIMKLSEAVENGGGGNEFDPQHFSGSRQDSIDFAKSLLEEGVISPVSWLFKNSPQTMSNICFQFSSFKEREENIFLVSDNLKECLEDRDRDIEIKHLMKEETFYFEFLKEDTFLYGTKNKIKSVFISTKKEIDSYFREEKTFLSGVAFCQGEDGVLNIFSFSPIEISLFERFSEILDHDVGKHNQLTTLKLTADPTAKIIEGQSHIDLLPSRDYKKRSLLKLILNLLVYVKLNNSSLEFKQNPKPTGGKKKREFSENNQTSRSFCKLSLDTGKDLTLINNMHEHSEDRKKGIISIRSAGGAHSLRREVEEVKEGAPLVKYVFKESS
tara:strand:+ start:7519 stop:8703 length:1185 start_codon:yes stop_codon:yes gene_type:complete